MSNNSTRNDVRQLAEKIEVLAREVQTKLQGTGDFLATANELTRNNMTLVFTLGEVYALEQAGSTSGRTVRGTTVSNPSGTVRWHNVRDSRGRFTRKI